MRMATPEEFVIDGCTHGSREVSLAVAVIGQALADSGLAGHVPINVAAYERSEAFTFVTAERGAWRDARDAWLEVAGIDPSAFDRRVRELAKRQEQADARAA
jgi:hypothetical protein